MNHQPKKASTRVIINTIAQYSRSLIGIIIALYSTRLVLNALGVDDYGIYSLIAGVVAMLSFISNALVSTTQRFLSFHQTRSVLKYQSILFGNILILHIFFSIILVVILEVLQPWLFGGLLNIEQDKIKAAKYVYQCSIFMVTVSFLSAPFLALLISHENIVYSSIIQVLGSFIRLGIAISVTLVASDRLQLYVSLLCIVSIFDFLAYGIYTFHKYDECIIPRLKYLDRNLLMRISGFLVWQIYSTGCIIGRTQGTAIVLNRFFGTMINASFGIAQQVSGAISFVSSSLINAINPQIVKAEGDSNRKKMFELSMVASKFSTFLLAMVIFPLVTEMPLILKTWLGEIPEYAVLFCRVILLTALVDQITIGLGTANQAIGNVRSYSLTVNTLKLSTVLIIALLLMYGVDLKFTIWAYAVMEFICAITRIFFLHISGGLNISKYIRTVFYSLVFPLLFLLISYYLVSFLSLNVLQIFLIVPVISLIYIIIFIKTGLSSNEELIVNRILNKLPFKLLK